ncbi:MAG: TonB-dependent receptor domain-containing protein, partial [Terriglobia bacterium]
NTPPGTAAIQGLTAFGGGVNSLSTPFHYWNSFQVSDDAFATKGNHSLKFGFYFERDQHNSHLGLRPNGEFNFGSLESFLTDSPLLFSGSPSGIGVFGARQSIAAGYVQDNWHLRPNLTADLGLRYEMVSVPTEAQNKQVNLRTFTAPAPHLGSPLYQNPSYQNFEPRVGFAWDAFHNGKTAIRGAFGIFDVLPLEYETFIQEIQSAPYVLVVTAKNLPAGSFFPGFGSTLGLNPAILQSAVIQFNPPRNYAESWNVNVQQQVTPNTMVSLGYIGNHAVHMYSREDDINSTIPTQTSAGLLFPFPAGSGTRLNPATGDIRGSWWGGDSEYDALEFQAVKRMSHGFQAQASYTWGKGLDSGSASVIGDPFTNSIPSLPVLWSCMSCWRGLTDFNIAQTLV